MANNEFTRGNSCVRDQHLFITNDLFFLTWTDTWAERFGNENRQQKKRKRKKEEENEREQRQRGGNLQTTLTDAPCVSGLMAADVLAERRSVYNREHEKGGKYVLRHHSVRAFTFTTRTPQHLFGGLFFSPPALRSKI